MEHREICTIGDLLIRGARAHPERDLIVLPEERQTYEGLLSGAIRFARSLLALGVEKGDKVGLLMPNSLLYQEVWFGASLIGAVAVPINNRFRAVELGHIIPDADIKVVMVATSGTDLDYFDRLVRALGTLPATSGEPAAPLEIAAAPALDYLVDLDGDGPRDGFMGRGTLLELGRTVSPSEVEVAAQRVALRDVAVIFYTSGTTALPKGCKLTHEAVSRQGYETVERMAFRTGDVMFSPLPMFHTACTQALYAMMWCFGTYCSMPVFDGSAGLRMIESEQATVMYTAFPPITNGLVQHEDFGPESFARVRSLFTTGTPEELRELEALMGGTRVITGFGMTEFAGSIAISDPRDPLELRIAPGRVLPGAEVQIREIIGRQELPAGEKGEIVARGPTVFSGYHNNEQATRESIDEDGWYHTGDLGLIDAKGLLHFRGRLKDMLKVGGENVASIEIEAYLQSHPGIRGAAVVGKPDAKYGEVPVAFVELLPGASITEEEIIEYCRDQIASYKIPRHVRFVDEWPMSATKIRKGDLRERVLEEFPRS